MRARRRIAIACALGLLVGATVAAPAAARSTVLHFTAVGPGVQALWVNDAGVTTALLVFHQLNAPDSRGYFDEVIVVREAWIDEETMDWQAVYDSWDAMPQPSIAIDQPLARASVEGSVPYLGCAYGTCPSLPSEVQVIEAWTGTGRIERTGNRYPVNDPGVYLYVGHGMDFFRDAVLSDADPFDGAFGDLGSLVSARFFDVHITSIEICHPGACG